jgi:energy-converting hydrogenase Eha subunit C
VKCCDQAVVASFVDSYWRNPLQPAQPTWGLLSSYEPLLAHEPKRKVAISSPREGWVALVESKEVVDFALAKALSEKLNTTILIVQLSEASGAAGYASAVCGEMMESQFNEEDADPLTTIRKVLKKYKVPFDATMFREAVQKTSEGWTVKKK